MHCISDRFLLEKSTRKRLQIIRTDSWQKCWLSVIFMHFLDVQFQYYLGCYSAPKVYKNRQRTLHQRDLLIQTHHSNKEHPDHRHLEVKWLSLGFHGFYCSHWTSSLCLREPSSPKRLDFWADSWHLNCIIQTLVQSHQSSSRNKHIQKYLSAQTQCLPDTRKDKKRRLISSKGITRRITRYLVKPESFRFSRNIQEPPMHISFHHFQSISLPMHPPYLSPNPLICTSYFFQES